MATNPSTFKLNFTDFLRELTQNGGIDEKNSDN